MGRIIGTLLVVVLAIAGMVLAVGAIALVGYFLIWGIAIGAGVVIVLYILSGLIRLFGGGPPRPPSR